MSDADTKAVLTAIRDAMCETLWEALEEKVTMMDPEEDLATGHEVLQKPPPQLNTTASHSLMTCQPDTYLQLT